MEGAVKPGRFRNVVALILALALGITAGCSGTSTGRDRGSAPGEPSPSETEAGPASPATDAADPAQQSPGTAPAVAGAAVQQADVERAGITVVADDHAAVPADSFTISGVQLERMLVEQSLGGGLVGSDLDVIAPMPDSLPPTSFLLQAWLAKGVGEAADAGRAAMGEAARATTGIADVVYPTVVVALFVADLGAMITAAVGDAGDEPGTAAPPGLRGGAAAFAGSAPCTAANEFIAQTIKGVFDLLKLDIPTGSGIFDRIIGTLADIWNYAVELARGVVTAVVGAITEAIFAKIRIVAAGLGAASILISYLKGQQLVVTVEPQFTRVASGSEPDIPGRYIARAHPLSKLWPPALMDCVTAAGGKMPELMLPGAVARWTFVDPPARAGLVLPATLTTAVAADHRAYLDFVTGREPAEWATGPETSDGPIVTVEVEQKGITDFLRETKDSLLGDLKGAIVGLIPVAQVRSALMSVIGVVLDPIANRIEAELNGSIGGMFTLKGHADPIMVAYHGEPEKPDPAPPSSPPPDPFCGKIRDLVAWANVNQELDMAPFSSEVLRRLDDARTVAPPQMLGPVDAGIPVYQAGATGNAMDLALLGLDGLTAWGYASQEILGYCRIRAEAWPQMPAG